MDKGHVVHLQKGVLFNHKKWSHFIYTEQEDNMFSEIGTER